MTLLTVSGLGVDVTAARRRLVRSVDLTIRPGRIVGLIGESGSGKSMIAHALMGLLPPGIAVTSGTATVAGRPVLDADGGHREDSRASLALVSQNPRAALNPTMRIGRQLERVLVQRRGRTAPAAREEVPGLLKAVGISDASRVARAFPHQLSGGMCQRVVIAMALSTEPSLLIADEPTTGLDVTIQAQILMLLRDLVREGGRSVLLVTHDLGVVSSLCDDVVVLYGGQVMERGATADVFRDPSHPYTRYLLESVRPSAGDGERLDVRDAPVDFGVAGCRFAPRCPLATEICRTTEPPAVPRGGTTAMCHHVEAA